MNNNIYDKNIDVLPCYEIWSLPIVTIPLYKNKQQQYEDELKKKIPKKIYTINDTKNTICPITLNKFINNHSLIRCFPLCNHGIMESSFNNFISHFNKCPLCNKYL